MVGFRGIKNGQCIFSTTLMIQYFLVFPDAILLRLACSELPQNQSQSLECNSVCRHVTAQTHTLKPLPMASASSVPPTPTYSVKEKVLCYHGPLVYEAKILKSQKFDDTNTKTGITGQHYQVHYKGWKQTWDEWVPPSRLLKWNEQNLDTQKSLQAMHAATASTGPSRGRPPKGDGVGASTSTRGRKPEARGTKRARDEDEVTSSKRQDMKLSVPEPLKVLLVDDWEAITKNLQLIAPLPRSPTVMQILEEFTNHCTNPPKANLREPALLTPTVVSGLQVYFDRSLGQNLLYRHERTQYSEIRKKYITGQQVQVGPEKRMSEVYGAEHLLRMLVAMPQMVAQSSLDHESITIIRDYVNELLLLLMEHKNEWFLSEYQNADPQYQNISRA
jgi:mortality factor 4-like protein 1